MLPGFKCATSLSVFVIVCFSIWHSLIIGVMMFCSGKFCFLDLKFPASLCHCVPMLHMSESGWNGNFCCTHLRRKVRKYFYLFVELIVGGEGTGLGGGGGRPASETLS